MTKSADSYKQASTDRGGREGVVKKREHTDS
jgi:hypothetical protein